jgi:hypothetical protein
MAASPKSTAIPPYPPGLVGKIAKFTARRLPYKMPNIAMATGLAAVSRLNDHRSVVVAPSGRLTPLNLYLLVTGHTGSGKETMREVLNMIGRAVTVVDQEGLISDDFASPQALARVLSERSATALLLFMDEFGHRLNQAKHSPGSSSASLNALLLEMHGLALNTYAGKQYSKSRDNVEPAILPYVSLLASTTEEPLGKALNDQSVFDGTLNRFLHLRQPAQLKRNEKRVYDNVSKPVVKACRRLWPGSSGAAQIAAGLEEEAKPKSKTKAKKNGGPEILGRKFNAITMSAGADTLFNKFDRRLDEYRERGGPKGALAGRATELAIRVAGIVALGCAEDLNAMRLEASHAEFGIELVEYSMAGMLAFVEDEIGGTVMKEHSRKILAFIIECIERPDEVKLSENQEHWRGIIREGYVPQSVITRKFHHTDRRIREEVLDTLVEADVLDFKQPEGPERRPGVYGLRDGVEGS